MRLSPLTVPYRALQRSSSVLLLAFFATQADAMGRFGSTLLVWALAGLAVLAVAAYELARYQRFEYELTEDTLDIRSGVVGRRERELPYRRIQNVDVTRNAVQRLLGIAAVGLETAGGDQTEGSIRYVPRAVAERLQREIQQRKRTGDAATTEEDDHETELYAITPRELTLVGALSFDPRVLGLLTLVGPGSLPFLPGGLRDPLALALSMVLILAAGLLAASWLFGVAIAVVNYYGFRLSRAGDELRYERGLVRRFEGTIPLEKVQTISITDNPLQRAFGYASLTVETAGYAGGSNGSGSQVAVPIATRERVRAIAEEIEPVGDVAFDRPPRRVRRRYGIRYLLGLAALIAAVALAARFAGLPIQWEWLGVLVVFVPPAAHLTWVHRGYAITPDHVVTRNGFWRRRTAIVPHFRVQTVIDSRSVFQRRWGVASVLVDTAGSSSLVGATAAAVDIEIPDAVELRDTLGQRLQSAMATRQIGRRRRSE